MIPRSLTVIQVILTITAILVVSVISSASDQVFIDTAQVKIFGPRNESHLGASSSGAGDVDADGIPDIVAGAPGAENRSDNDGGNAYILRGSANPDTEIDLRFPPMDSVIVVHGGANGDQLGYSVSGAGDMNGDGADDFLVSAPGAGGTDPDDDAPDTGRAYVIYGSPDLPHTINVSSLGSAGITIIGSQEDGRFGSSVSSAGDFNNDGYADILIGAPFESHNDNGDAGAAYLILGGPSLSSWMDLSDGHANVARFQTGGSDHRVGASVADLEDFNGDGISDIAITSLRYGDDGGSGSGRAWIIYGGSTPSGVTNLNGLENAGLSGTTIRIPEANHELGQAICCAGDADSDGDTEVLVTRSLHDNDPETIATVGYLVRGSQAPDTSINLGESHPMVTRYETFYDNKEEGQSVHGTLDVTGDGVDDHAISVPRSVLLEEEKGSAHRVNGGQNLGSSQILDLFQHTGRGFLGFEQDQQVGASVGAAGDFNNDRGNDMMIGAPGSQPFGRNEAGALYVFLGQRLRSPNSVETSALGQTVSISWNNRAVYDNVVLYRDGQVLTTLSGDTQSYTDENVAEGTHTYMVDGSRRDVTSVKKGSTIRVLDPADISDCISRGRDVTFTWMNQDVAYQAIDVYRDGNLIASLPGAAQMYVDEDVSFQIGHTYELIQRGDRTTTLARSCTINVLQPPDNPQCSAAPNATNQNIAQLSWSNGDGSTPYDEILVYRDGQILQTLAGNAVSTTDTIDPGRYVYEIEGRTDGDRAISTRGSCTVTDPIAPTNLTCSSETNAAGEHH
ncbi:MAG: integrin alpha, partial [Planctomycetota bacterium]